MGDFFRRGALSFLFSTRYQFWGMSWSSLSCDEPQPEKGVPRPWHVPWHVALPHFVKVLVSVSRE